VFVFGLPARFEGYYPGYSAKLEQHHNYFTWAVLKAHTVNRAGEVLLQSEDPREPPKVVFHYFDEGTDGGSADLDAVVDGVQIARDVMRRAGDLVTEEISPGEGVKTRISCGSGYVTRPGGTMRRARARSGPPATRLP
jgi:choline dehydrogenase